MILKEEEEEEEKAMPCSMVFHFLFNFPLAKRKMTPSECEQTGWKKKWEFIYFVRWQRAQIADFKIYGKAHGDGHNQQDNISE